MKILASTLASLCILFAVGCTSTEAPELAAEQLSMTELTKSPGYSWFVAEMTTYSPNTEMVSQINTSMATRPGSKVLIFVRPSCSCRGTQRLFPQVMRTLVDAKVDTSRIEIWSMRNATDKQPYQSTFTITSLPAIYVLESGAVRSRVIDADYTDTNADSLIARAVK